jgi:hypothetical protein
MVDHDEKVGRGRPPSQHRFKKGQSGNPNGRPKGVRNLKIELEDELNEKVGLTEGGKRTFITKQRAIVKALVAKAINGDARAATAILTIRSRLIDDQGESGGEISDSDKTLVDKFLERELAKRARREKVADRPTRANEDKI